MTDEQKQLLVKELCARLPYGVKVQVADEYSYKEPLEILAIDARKGIAKLGDNVDDFYFTHVEKIEDIKPYLRPKSSITAEEREHFINTCIYLRGELSYWWTCETYDWFNANHIDYRGLIEQGLALPATEDMYNFK